MMPSKGSFILFIYLIMYVAGKKYDLLIPCRIDDMKCIRGTTQLFMKKTAMGITQLGITPIDPLKIAKLDYDVDNFECSHHIRDLWIIGLKDLQIANFQMDTINKKVQMSLYISVIAEGDIAAEYHHHHLKARRKPYTGHFVSEFKTLATIRYPYSVKMRKDGIMHYVIGQESTTFEMQSVPTYELYDELINTKHPDPQLAQWRKIMLTHTVRDTILKQLVNVVIVPTLVHNLRQAAVHLPMSAFFKTS